ncbi:MAG: hypothetical protein C4539_09505 [Ignavibacteriales bacterium]|nr:MAG: hypothetical protein C4539_09505 [Ignavibacteriales bacterium]
MLSILNSIYAKHKNGLVQLIFLADAVDRLINRGYSVSDVEILNNSFTALQKEFFVLCENEEAYLFPIFFNENKFEQVELLKKEHLQIQEILRSVQSSIDLINHSQLNDGLLTKLKYAVKNLNLYISSHLQNENKLFPEANKKFTVKKSG